MNTREMMEVMQAYLEGKRIEFRPIDKAEEWLVTTLPMWNWSFYVYRIKPEPTYKPYDSVNEVDKDKWVKGKNSGALSRITGIDPQDTLCIRIGLTWYDLNDIFKSFTYEDGTPCGKEAK